MTYQSKVRNSNVGPCEDSPRRVVDGRSAKLFASVCADVGDRDTEDGPGALHNCEKLLNIDPYTFFHSNVVNINNYTPITTLNKKNVT